MAPKTLKLSSAAVVDANAGVPKKATAPFVSKGTRNEMETCFERFRQLDRAEEGDTMGMKGIQQVFTELSIPLVSLEGMVILWRLGVTRYGYISRVQWLRTMFTYKIESMTQLKMKALEWIEDVKTNSESFAQMYNFMYDYVRGEDDRLMAPGKAVAAWEIFFMSEKHIELWNKWVRTEYKREVSRDLWRELRVFFSTVPKLDQFDLNGNWPTAIDDFAVWATKQ